MKHLQQTYGNRTLSVFALAGVVFLSSAAFAQHGGHAASGAHASGGGFRSSPSAAPQSFAPPSRSSAPRPSFGASAMQRGYPGAARPYTAGNWTSFGFVPTRNPYNSGYNSRENQRNRRVGYGVGFNTAYGLGYGLLGYPYYGFGYPFDYYDPNDPNLQADALPGGYGGDYPGQQPAVAYDPGPEQAYAYPQGPTPDANQDTARMPYGGSNGAEIEADANDGMSHPKVTLVLKNGERLQMRNYAATPSKILITDDGNQRVIYISSLDLPATQAANNAAGVDFSLPFHP